MRENRAAVRLVQEGCRPSRQHYCNPMMVETTFQRCQKIPYKRHVGLHRHHTRIHKTRRRFDLIFQMTAIQGQPFFHQRSKIYKTDGKSIRIATAEAAKETHLVLGRPRESKQTTSADATWIETKTMRRKLHTSTQGTPEVTSAHTECGEITLLLLLLLML